MPTMTPGERAWLWLTGGIITWDVLGPETLSAAAARHPRKTWLIGAVVLGHLTRAWPRPIDRSSEPIQSGSRRFIVGFLLHRGVLTRHNGLQRDSGQELSTG